MGNNIKSSRDRQMTLVTRTLTFLPAYQEAVRDLQYQAVATLSLVVWDFLLTLEEEIEYVWRMQRCVLKWLYFYFRYGLLAAEIFHLVVLPSLSSGDMSDFLCTMWYRYATFISQVSSCMIEIILATRVFALFNRSRKVGLFLGGLISLELVAGVLNIAECSEVEYEVCILPRPVTKVSTPSTCITMIVQSIIICMIIFKHFVGLRLGWGRTPLLSLLVRDATGYYALAFLICGVALVISALEDMRILAILYWSTSLYSAFGCRLILNMEHFARGNPSDKETMFTSHISL